MLLAAQTAIDCDVAMNGDKVCRSFGAAVNSDEDKEEAKNEEGVDVIALSLGSYHPFSFANSSAGVVASSDPF